MSGQAPNNISHNPVFYARENVLTDRSVIWEVWQRGSEQRLASAATEAERVAHCLRHVMQEFENRTPHNTVDA